MSEPRRPGDGLNLSNGSGYTIFPILVGIAAGLLAPQEERPRRIYFRWFYGGWAIILLVLIPLGLVWNGYKQAEDKIQQDRYMECLDLDNRYAVSDMRDEVVGKCWAAVARDFPGTVVPTP